jgi:predicted RNase H-like nuclease
MNGPRLLGLDLAWSVRNPSGVAALAPDGTLLDVRADLRGDDEILAWVRSWRGSNGVIGIDMPTIVPNATGMRACERELGSVFRGAHAAPHPANRGRFPDGGRARRLIDALRDDGVCEALDVVPDDPRTVALEVFPHPAHVRLFDLPTTFKYKRKPGTNRPPFRDEWVRYRAALASLRDADPPLVLDARVPDDVAGMRGAAYKYWDDALDAISCAYVASFVHRWGCGAPHVRVFGDLALGYIVVPDRAAFSRKASRVTTAHDRDEHQNGKG